MISLFLDFVSEYSGGDTIIKTISSDYDISADNAIPVSAGVALAFIVPRPETSVSSSFMKIEGSGLKTNLVSNCVIRI